MLPHPLSTMDAFRFGQVECLSVDPLCGCVVSDARYTSDWDPGSSSQQPRIRSSSCWHHAAQASAWRWGRACNTGASPRCSRAAGFARRAVKCSGVTARPPRGVSSVEVSRCVAALEGPRDEHRGCPSLCLAVVFLASGSIRFGPVSRNRRHRPARDHDDRKLVDGSSFSVAESSLMSSDPANYDVSPGNESCSASSAQFGESPTRNASQTLRSRSARV